MRKIVLVFIVFSIAAALLLARPYSDPGWTVDIAHRWNVPPWVDMKMKDYGLDTLYSYYYEHNPFYIRGDFNGDGEPDVTIMVENEKVNMTGFIIFHYGTEEYFIFGAGTSTSKYETNDYRRLDIWRVSRKKSYHPGIKIMMNGRVIEYKRGSRTEMIGEALHFEKVETSQILLAWTGTGYQWSYSSE
ncbi:MAG: hypothetical protein IH914_09830 [candidate division Zixibacteria bacterium]|nr:hypothetical protein [candidate division Zixibacteria bacterium]